MRCFFVGYDYRFQYKPSKCNGNVDGLSRLPIALAFENIRLLEFDGVPVTAEVVAKCSARDTVLVKVIQCVKHNWW